jgi:hypothetical protein
MTRDLQVKFDHRRQRSVVGGFDRSAALPNRRTAARARRRLRPGAAPRRDEPRPAADIHRQHRRLDPDGRQRGAPRLLWQVETSRWGADDNELEIFVDSVLLRHISNDEIGDFEHHDVRDVNQWIHDLQPHFGGVAFKVIELDDTSPDDIGQETLKPGGVPDGWNRSAVTKSDDDRTMRLAMAINVDDETYAAQVSVTTWDEQF